MGLKYDIGPYKGEIRTAVYRRSRNYYWNAFSSSNSVGFDALKLTKSQKRDLVKSILGYVDEGGDFPYCDSEADVIKVCDTLTSMLSGSGPALSLGDRFTIGSKTGVLATDGRGVQFYWTGDESAIFKFLPSGRSKYDFQRAVLGYSDDSGCFPWCHSLKDLIKFCQAIHEAQTESKPKEILSTPTVPDEFAFTKRDGSLLKGTLKKGYCDRSWYWYNPSGDNDDCFLNLKFDKYDFQKLILGYTKRNGTFPECSTKEDLYKFCLAIENTIQSTFHQEKGPDVVIVDHVNILKSSHNPFIGKLTPKPEDFMSTPIPPPKLINVERL